MEAPEVSLLSVIGQIHRNMQHLLQHRSTKNLCRTDGSDRRRAKLMKKYTCNLCFRQFVYENGLARHVSKFHPEKEEPSEADNQQQQSPINVSMEIEVVVKCKTSGVIFPGPFLFQKHLLKFRFWECLLCALDALPVSDKAAAIFQDHVSIVTIQTLLRCEFCDILFSNCNSLFRHESLHSADDGYTCTFCKITFLYLGDVLAHRERCIKYKRFSATFFPNVAATYCCNVCVGLFATLPELYAHRYGEYHLFPRRIVSRTLQQPEDCQGLWARCEHCLVRYNDMDSLLIHRAEYHPAVENNAALNERSSPTSSQPRQQSATERKKRTIGMDEPNGDRPYLCDKCGKTYTQSSHLWQHLRFHNGVRPFACDRDGCARRFTIRPDLSDHIRKCHTGERPYECNVCHKRFLTGSVYYQHRLIHRGERRYGCPDCDRRFYRADALKNHQRIHTGEKPYACEYCERKFRQRGDREKHVRVKHKRLV